MARKTYTIVNLGVDGEQVHATHDARTGEWLGNKRPNVPRNISTGQTEVDVKKRTVPVRWQPSVTWWCTCSQPTKAKGQHLKVGNSVLSKCGSCSRVILTSKRKGKS